MSRGFIKKRGNGYRIAVRTGRNPSTGKYEQVWETVKGTKRDAEKRLAEILHQMDIGIFIKPGKITLAEFLEKWLKDYAWPNLAPRTAEGYDHIIHRHLIPALGHIQLTQLKPSMIQKYQVDKLANGRIDGKGGLSSKTVNHHHVTLHDALESAVKWELIMRNPVDAVDPPHFVRHEFRVMDENGINSFLDHARPTAYYPIFYTALHTGMRRSEVLALRWQDIDLFGLTVSITHSLHHLREGSLVFRPCKTDKSRRLISLTPSNAVVLKEHWESQNKLRESLGLPAIKNDDLIFCQLDGKPLLPDSITHYWIKMRNRYGFKGVRFHDARHTFASIHLKNGTHVKIVQEALGHSSVTTTLDTYSHIIPGLQQAAAAKFDELLKPKENKLDEELEDIIQN